MGAADGGWAKAWSASRPSALILPFLVLFEVFAVVFGLQVDWWLFSGMTAGCALYLIALRENLRHAEKARGSRGDKRRCS